MFTNNKLSKAVRLAVIFGAASATAFAASVNAAEEDEAAKKVERIEITGSRLKRTDMEGALPVTIIGSAELKASGDISVADFMRDTNFNSFGSYQSTSGSSGGGAAQVSLRGLGAGRTLILVDGRRTPTSPILGSGQDLNSIPMAAVERIEVLSDGASAVYGSDAIAGVINIITRKDFEGVEFSYGLGKPTNAGGDTEEMSFVIGSAGNKSRVLFGASFNSRDVIYTRDRDYWYTDDNPGASSYSNNFSQKLLVDGKYVHASSLGAAGRLKHPDFGAAVPGLCTNGDDSDLYYLTGSTAANKTCQFNHSATSANLTSVKNLSLFGRGNYQINDDWSTYVNGGFNQVTSFGRFAALPSSPWAGGAITIEAGSPNHPGTAPADGGFNPNYDAFYAQYANEDLSLYHRFAALGPRDNHVENTTTDFTAGFEGTIGEVSLDFGVRYVKSRAINMGENYVVAGLAQPQITSGAYNIYDPFSGDPKSLGMTATTSRDMHSSVKEVYANASFDVFELAGGIASAAVGAEYREEDYQDKYDLLSGAGQVSGSSGSSAGGSRNVRAIYGEMLFPVIDSVDIEIAGRYDKYSDYGGDFAPKIAARWRPTAELLVRASYGEGFRAPTLRDISLQPAFSAAYTGDEATCIALTGSPCTTAQVQVNTYSMGNVNLKSEQSKQYGLGLVWEASDWLNMSVDYYNIEITDSISSTSLATAVGCLRGTVSVCPSGVSQFPNGTTFPNPALGVGVSFEGNQLAGAITGAQLGSVNLGKVETNGLDFSAQTNFDLGWGQLRNNFTTSYVQKYSVNGGDNASGDYGYPKYKATLTNILAVGDFSINWNISATASQDDRYLSGGEVLVDHIPTWIIHNIQASYNAPWDATISVGVNNVADKAPADAELYGTSYDYYMYSPWGRVPYIRYTQRF
ncbi:TonB-dependent receptor [Rheinheimera metallidurans]|uniref:TonB-dependent receptor n=1 Tax=Rheinheimera metallidurans TaxID=2925781 RepID=UPI003001FEAB